MSQGRSSSPAVARALPGDGLPPRGAGEADASAPRRSEAPVVALGAAPRVSSRCAWQVVEKEAVLLDLDGRRVLGLNPVGSFVFPLIDGTRTVGGLAAEVAQRFGVPVQRAEADLQVFLAGLAQRGFVEGVGR